MTCFLHSNYWQSKMLYWLSANYDAFLYGVAKNTFRYRSCPQTHKQMNRLMADNQADGLSGKLKGRFMARKRKTGKRTGKRGQRETGMGRQTDGQTVWTDRQMVILLGKAGSDEMDKQAIRRTYQQTGTLLGRNKWTYKKMNRLDILIQKWGWDAWGQAKRGRCISVDHQHEEGLSFKACMQMCVCAFVNVCI